MTSPSNARATIPTWQSHDVPSPLIIGGVGGGGTRVYRAIARSAGFDMLVAPWILRAFKPQWHDNWLLMKFFYPKWVTPYLRNELNRRQMLQMRAACRALLWLSGPPSYNRKRKPWGWKNPNSMFLIPFFKDIYPNMLFLHVVRDGRDHAFHPTFPYLKHHNRLMFKDEELRLEDHLRKGLFWSRCNSMIEANARVHLHPDRYLLSRFEDLCTDPAGEAKRIFAFLGTHDSNRLATAVKLVRKPPSYNRWRREPADRIVDVERLIGADLARYGYPLTQT